MVKYSRNASATKIKNTVENNHGGLKPTKATSNGIPTAAVPSLELRLASTGPHRSSDEIIDLFVSSTESAPPSLEIEQSLKIFPFAEIGPQGGRNV